MQPQIVRGDVGLDGNGQEVLTGFSLPSSGPAIILIPLLVYGRAMQVERLAFDIAANDLSAFISCERFRPPPSPRYRRAGGGHGAVAGGGRRGRAGLGELFLDRLPRPAHRLSRTRESGVERDWLWRECLRLTGAPDVVAA